MISGNLAASKIKRKGEDFFLKDGFVYSVPSFKITKRQPDCGGKLPVAGSAVKRDMNLADGQSYGGCFESLSDRDLLEKDFARHVEASPSDDRQVFISSVSEGSSIATNRGESIGPVLERNKDDLTICSFKGDDHVRISISSDAGFVVPPVSISANRAGADPLDHSYQRPVDNSSDSETSDPVRSTWVTTKADKAQLRNSGHSWKKGKWSEMEIKLLEGNIEKYCTEHGIEDARQIIYNASKDERPNFYSTVATGLDRPLFSVYRRVKRMYDSQNHRGKYSPKEVAKLKDLHAKYGRDWAVIGQEMGRSSDSVKDRCRLVMNGTHNPGKWLEEEELRLAKAVYEATGVQEGTSVTSNICWTSVAEKVSTRTKKQCRAKWLNYLNWKKCDGKKWTKTDDAVLLERIVTSGAESEETIDWEVISKGWKSSRSPQWLRIKWWSLKQFYLGEFPDISGISFKCLVHELSKLIVKQISSWDHTKRSRKPFANPDVRMESHKEPSRKIPKLKAEVPIAKAINAKPGKSISLMFAESTADSNVSHDLLQDVFYVTDINGKVQGRITLDKDLSENLTVTPFIPEMEESEIDRQQTVKEDQQLPATSTASIDEYLGMDATLQLAPTNTPGVFLVQNSDSNNPLMLVLSDDVNSVDFAPEALYINSTSSAGVSIPSDGDVTDDIRGDGENCSPTDDGMTSSDHNDVITTSDVLVYQETSNDDDARNPMLGSVIHEVATAAGQEDEENCFIQGSSPLQGTLLEGTDLASSTLRIDVPP